MLSGKDFDRGLCGFIRVDDALNRRFLLQFRKWCIVNDRDIAEETRDLLPSLKQRANSETLPADINIQLSNVVTKDLVPLIE